MITVEIFNKLIQLDLQFEDKFQNAFKYIKEGTPEYIMKSELIEEPKKLSSPIEVNKSHDIYLLEDGSRYQIQRDFNGNVIGTITYHGKNITIGLIDNSFPTEYLLSQYGMVYIIGSENALLMHGSTLVYKNKGIMFTAPSGTGKSTHSRLWQKYADVTVLNDDKNILALEDDKIMLYPSPWSGKHHLDNNVKSTLDCIVFLYQNPTNVVERMKPGQAFRLMLTQLEAPSNTNRERWDLITDKLLTLPIYRLGCNMEKDAFDTLRNRLEEDLYANQ